MAFPHVVRRKAKCASDLTLERYLFLQTCWCSFFFLSIITLLADKKTAELTPFS